MILITDCIEGALLMFSSNNSQSTERIYRVHLNQLHEWLTMRGVTTIDQLEAQHILDFYTWIKTDYKPKRLSGDTSPYAPASLANVWCALRMFDKFLVDEFRFSPLTKNLKKPHWKPPQIEPFTHDQVSALLEAALHTKESKSTKRKTFKMKRPTGKRDHFLLILMLDTGLRVGEVSRLNINDYNQSSGEIRVRPFGTGRKTKPRTVYLGKAARRSAWRYLSERNAVDTIRPDDPLFLTKDGRERMNRNAIRLICQRAGERAGVQNCHPHRFRHTFAIEYLRNGGNIYVLSEKLLGHSDLSITKRYLALVDDDAFNEHQRASPADRWRL